MASPSAEEWDQLSDARILKVTKGKIALNRKRRLWFTGFGMSSLLLVSGLGVAVARTNSDTAQGDASAGVVCWVGRYEISMAIQVGSDISPINRCAKILNSRFSSKVSSSILQGCVAPAGIVNIVPINQSCESLSMKNLDHNYPFVSIEFDQVRAIVRQSMAAQTCQNSDELGEAILLSLRQAGHTDWQITITGEAGRKRCSLATLLLRNRVVLIIPGGSK